MSQKKRFLLTILSVLVITGSIFTFNFYSEKNLVDNNLYGPSLLTESETKKLVLREGYLDRIDSFGMSTAGPIYRVVFGIAKDKREKALWVNKDIVHSVYMDEGISKEDVLQIVSDRNINEPFDIELIYISKTIELEKGVYWFVKNKDKYLFIDFKDRNKIYERKSLEKVKQELIDKYKNNN